MVVACIALAVALGGTGYAAINLPKNSVGTKQLKKNAVTMPKIRKNAITGAKVANNSLTGADVNEASLAQVPSAATATTAGSAAPSGTAGGGLAGTYPNPTIGANAVGSASIVDAVGAAGLRKADIAAVSTTVAFDPPNIPAQSCTGLSAAAPGAQVGDVMVIHPVNSTWTNLIWAPYAVFNGTVSIRVCNPIAAAQDGSAVSFYLLLIR